MLICVLKDVNRLIKLDSGEKNSLERTKLTQEFKELQVQYLSMAVTWEILVCGNIELLLKQKETTTWRTTLFSTLSKLEFVGRLEWRV